MREKGLSLIELLVVLFIIAGCMLFVSPVNRAHMSKVEKDTIIQNLKSGVQYARLQAIIKGDLYYLESLSKTDDWSKGMSLKRMCYPSGNELVYQWRWKLHYWQIQWQGFQSKKGLYISSNPAHMALAGSFILKSTIDGSELKISMNRLGSQRLRP